MTTTITREFVLEGAVKAIHASRVFLIDALFQYRNQRYPSAYITGIIAAEQLGRAMWMIVRYHEMVKNNEQSTDAKKFAKELRNVPHRQNLRKGVMSYAMPINEEMQKLNNIIQTSAPNSPEPKASLEQYSKICRQYYEDMIEAYHLTREQIQYVNPDPSFTHWTSPTQITQEQVRKLLENVGIDNRVVTITQMDEANPVGKEVDRVGLRSYLLDLTTTYTPEEWNIMPERYKQGVDNTKTSDECKKTS